MVSFSNLDGFLQGSEYWKFDPEKKPPVSRSYPKPISNWDGIPNNIDSALKYSNGYTYFFKDGRYWRFDDTKFKVHMLITCTDTQNILIDNLPIGISSTGCPMSS